MKFTFAPESTPLKGYTIKRAIHRGGFGEVYYALSDTGKEVALKLLQENSDVELRGVSQCLNLKHPNLVTIFNVLKDDDGDHWIVMEFVSGKTLSAALEDHPRGMPMEDVRRWVTGIAAGVDYLHSHGIVHRDLKPGNIFSDHGSVKVGDVGLSKFIAPSKRSEHTQSVGTVYYMAPEVAQGRYGKQVDVYALGVMIYEMITGKVPFDGESTGEILMKHLSSKPDLSLLPERFRPVVAAALEKDPQLRTSSVKELERQFHAAVRGDAPSSPPVEDSADVDSPKAHWKQWKKSHWKQHKACWKGKRKSRDSKFYRDDFIWGWMFKNPAPHSPPATSGSPNVATQAVPVSTSPREPKSAVREVLEVIANYWWVLLIFLFTVRPNGNQLALIITLSVLGALLYLSLQVIDLIRDAIHGTDSRRGRAGSPPYVPPEVRPQPAVVHPVAVAKKNPEQIRPQAVVKTALLPPLTFTQRLSRFCLSTATDMACVLLICGVLWAMMPFAYLSSAKIPQNVPKNLVAFLVASTVSVTFLIRSVLAIGSTRKLHRWQMFWLLGLTGIFLAGPGVTFLAQFLLVDTTVLEKGTGIVRTIGPYPINNLGHVTPAGYCSFFGILLALRSWWKMTDDSRTHRFSVAAVFNTVFVSILALVLIDNLPWMFCILWAAIIATTLQVSSSTRRHPEQQQYRHWRHA